MKASQILPWEIRLNKVKQLDLVKGLSFWHPQLSESIRPDRPARGGQHPWGRPTGGGEEPGRGTAHRSLGTAGESHISKRDTPVPTPPESCPSAPSPKPLGFTTWGFLGL